MRISRHEDNLITEIEQDALDDRISVAAALRKCIVLGGRSGSEALPDWATRELKGYVGEADLPSYRVILAPLTVDGFSGNFRVEHQQIAPSMIPDFAQEIVSERLELRHGVGDLEALLKLDQIKLQPPGAADLLRIMNSGGAGPFQRIDSLYWSVSHAAIQGVLDQIRTALTQLIAEVRASMSADDVLPSAEAANQAVTVIVTGKRAQVQVVNAQASGPGSQATSTVQSRDETSEPRGFWTTARKIGAFVVGAATVVGTIVVVVEFVH